MQITKTIVLSGPNPADLSWDDEQREKRLRDAQKYKEELDEFIEEEKALLANPDATITFSGRMIRRHPMRRKELTDRLLQDPLLATDLIALGVTLKTLEALIQNFPSALRDAFGIKAEDKKTVVDDKYMYDTEKTNVQVWEKLYKERQEVSGMEAALREWMEAEAREGRPIDPMNEVYFSPYMSMVQDIAELANAQDMRPHPKSFEFVHSIARVHDEEEKTPLDDYRPQFINYLVPVYRPLLGLSATDSRRQRLKYEELYATDDVDGIAGNEPDDRLQVVVVAPGIGLDLK